MMDVSGYSENASGQYRNYSSYIFNDTGAVPYNPSDFVYDEHYRAKVILTQPQNVLILALGIIAIVINVLSIFALSKIGQSSSRFRLILNLAISDVLIGFSLLFFQFINAFVQLYPPGLGPVDKRLVSRCLFCFSKALNTTGLAITLLNLLGMAIDHYIAIMHPLRYMAILNHKRCVCMITGQWIVAVILGFSNFFSGFPRYAEPNIRKRFNYCEFIHLTKYQEEYMVFVLSLICLVSMLFIYIRIYLEVKKHQARTPQLSQEIIKNKKAIITTLLILGTFILCWIPMAVYSVVLTLLVYVNPELIAEKVEILVKVDSSLFILLLLNVITDPIIYAARAKEVQVGYKRLCCRKYLARRYSSANEHSQNTAFLDLPRNASRSSSNVNMAKYHVNTTSEPILNGLSGQPCHDVSVINADSTFNQ